METSDVKIKKAKLCKNGTVEATYIDSYGNEIIIKGKNKSHNDLRVAFAAIVPYFADLTEQKEADYIDWLNLESDENIDRLRKIEVTGISIGGDDNNRIVTITGKRTLITSRVLNLNAPGVEIDAETLEWEHLDEFDIAVQGAIYEVKQYIVNQKWEVSQGQLDFGGNPDDPFSDAQPTDDTQPIEQTDDQVA